MAYEIAIPDTMLGGQYEAMVGQVLVGRTFPCRSGTEAVTEPTLVDLSGGIPIEGRPSILKYEAKLPNGKVVGMINTASGIASLCPDIKSLLDGVMQSIARVDNAMCIKGNGQIPTFFDYSCTIGCGTGVIVPPDDLRAQIGNKDMTSSQLQRQYILAFRRLE